MPKVTKCLSMTKCQGFWNPREELSESFPQRSVFLWYLYLIQDFFGNANLHLIFFLKIHFKTLETLLWGKIQTHSTPHEGFIFVAFGAVKQS